MKILLVNKFYFPQGGADKHVLQLEEMLTRRGHEVAVFAMSDPRNRPSKYAKYFVSPVDFSRVRFNWQGLRVLGRTLHSFEAARKMKKLLADFQPDVVHIHNIYHQLSPSILPVIHQAGIPIVQTLHDYALISANFSLYAHGGICTHGKFGRYDQYLWHRCIKNSVAASALAMIDQWWHARRRIYERNVSVFISPSRFLRDLVLDWTGEDLDIRVLPNFLAEKNLTIVPNKGNYVLYLGRLSAEKGVDLLLQAVAGTNIRVKIVGTGPEEKKLRELAEQLGLANIEWLGFKDGTELQTLIAQAQALVVPSKWYENCPLVALEALAAGTPVIGARIGGIPELIQDGQTGYLFSPNRPAELRDKLKLIMTHPATTEAMSRQARVEAAKYSIDRYYQQLKTIYETARGR